VRTPAENMAKGKRLLNEGLMLHPEFHEARIYLGHAYHVSEEHDLACREFRAVLSLSSDAIIRAFALENLGNVYLERGRCAESIPYFREVVDSGVIGRESRFFTIYFNLALAHGLLEKFEACREWLDRLYREFPHKRRLIGQELRKRTQLATAMAPHAAVVERFAADFPGWFPLSMEAC
jgi:tetratricopeptide (TPR) repeat protein